MFDIVTKFRYFHGILKEVYQIIEINYEIKDTDVNKLLSIIHKHLDQYNSKSGMVRIGMSYQEESGKLDIYLYDYVRGRGQKRVFSDTISVKSIMRDMILDELLNDDIDMSQYE